jgi:hypothetical protein
VSKKPAPSRSALLVMIKDARTNIEQVPGALQRTGMELRLIAQEKRLGLRKP